MRFRWPPNTVFRHMFLDVEQKCCVHCGGLLHVGAHRWHRIYTLQGPLALCCRLARCADPTCSSRPGTLSPAAELSFTLPGWLIGWDVFCFLGHRRFARHWSVPQIRDELSDSYQIRLSDDAISVYLRRYQTMVAARQQDPALLRLAYQQIDALWLSIDGLQPEKGHETLYAVRELNARRVWFAEALLSSNTDEVRRLLVRTREFAHHLGKPVRMWVSDKQDAFVKGIAQEFPGVPHRYCVNHFLRDLAKPTLELASHAKVQMRKKVRGLRDIERAVLQTCRQANAEAEQEQGVAAVAAAQGRGAPPTNGQRSEAKTAAPSGPHPGTGPAVRPGVGDQGSAVVLDYCAAVRGILNDDQGGPLHPPGLRMAEALLEVRASLGRNLALHKAGPAHRLLARLAGCIDAGLSAVRPQQEQIQEQVKAISEVARTLEKGAGALRQRRRNYQRLQRAYQNKGEEFSAHLARVMRSWGGGLFVSVRGKKGQEPPQDNLELERWFRTPKRHERRIHGRRHAGMRIVQEGPTLLLVLNAHEAHPQPFTAENLLPYRHAQDPADQVQAIYRRKVMRKARSPKNDNIFSRS
jgi:hypothetical protein